MNYKQAILNAYTNELHASNDHTMAMLAATVTAKRLHVLRPIDKTVTLTVDEIAQVARDIVANDIRHYMDEI